MANNSETIQSISNLSMGQAGYEVLTGTAAHSGDWIALVAWGGSAKFSSITATNSDTITSGTLPDAAVLVGPITAFTLTSGTVLAYKRK